MNIFSIFKKDEDIEIQLQDEINKRVSLILENLNQDNTEQTIATGKIKHTTQMFNNTLNSKSKIGKHTFIKSATKEYNASNNTITITSPYDYDRIDKFFSKEGYYARSISRQYETMLRNGFGYVSENVNLIKITRMKLNQIERNNSCNLQQLFASIHTDISLYGISIIQKIYDQNGDISKLKIIKPNNCKWIFNTNKDLVGIIPEEDIFTKKGGTNIFAINNRIKSLFFNSQDENMIPASDIIVLKLYQDDMDFFPEPYSIQLLDDILTLRSIEESIDFLIYQYGSPILHAKVGTDDFPCKNPYEIEAVREQIESMAANGFIVTNHRISIEAINLLKNLSDLTSLLEYYKTRILIGSGSSSVLVGEGDTSNRSTASSIDDALSDHCMYFANIICFMFNYYLIPEILKLDITDERLYNEYGEFIIQMTFNEMKLEKQIQIQNSTMNLYHGNILPMNRVLRKLKEPPLSAEEEKQLYIERVQKPLKETNDPINNMIDSQNQPQNQYGKKNAPGSNKN
jgi:hypothetical protein